MGEATEEQAELSGVPVQSKAYFSREGHVVIEIIAAHAARFDVVEGDPVATVVIGPEEFEGLIGRWSEFREDGPKA